MEDFYITGEPDTNSEASLVIDFENNTDSDWELDEQVRQNYSSILSNTQIYVSFDQINMKDGTFSQV